MKAVLAILVFAALAQGALVRYEWDALTAKTYPPLLRDSDSETEADGAGLQISGPSPPIVANVNAATVWRLNRDGKAITDKTITWKLFKGPATQPSLMMQGAMGRFLITSAADYTVKATFKGETASASFVVGVKEPEAIKIWHNGDFLPLHREGPVLFAVKPDPAIRAIQWNIGGQVRNGNIAWYTMKQGETSVTAKVTLFPANKDASKSFSVTVTRPTASAPRKRYNIYEMPLDARKSWQNALNSIKAWGIYDYLIEAHLIVAGMRRMNSMTTDAHNSPAFTIWHRMFIDVYERSLMAEGLLPGYGAPFWNFQNEGGKDGECLWTADLMGNRRGQVKDGFMKGWKGYGDEHDPNVPETMPVSREPPTTLYPVPQLVKQWQDTLAGPTFPSFETMRRQVEGIHNYGHVNVGGDMNTMASPNDPLFWMVHMWTEKTFTEWQKNPRCTEANKYYGSNRRGARALPTDLLSPWDVTVSTWFEPSAGAVFVDTCDSDLCKRCGMRPIGANVPPQPR